MVIPVDAPKPTPFQMALDVRRNMLQSMRDGINYDTIVGDDVTSCIIGLSTDVLGSSHFNSIAILPAGERKHRLFAGTTMLTAQAAFDAWASDEDPRLRLQFDLEMFKALYGLVQMTRTGSRTNVIRHMTTTFTPLLLETLSLQTGNANWHSLVADLLKSGEFDSDAYYPLIQGEIIGIVQRIKDTGLGQEVLNNYSLETLFNARRE